MIFDGRGAPKAHIYKKPLPALRATLPKGEGIGCTINSNLPELPGMENLRGDGFEFCKVSGFPQPLPQLFAVLKMTDQHMPVFL